MASTRSNRRADGLDHTQRPRHHVDAVHSHPPPARAANPPGPVFAPSDCSRRGRPKRALEPSDRDVDALKAKRSRIAVEILARQQHQQHQQHQQQQQQQGPPGHSGPPPPTPWAPTAAAAAGPPALGQGPATTAAHANEGRITSRGAREGSPTRTAAPAAAAAAPGAHQPSARPAARGSRSRPAEQEGAGLVRNQAKVTNGIKAELDKPQPQKSKPPEQGRKLRSQEATRFKSDLSAYFPDYDEVIGNDPKEQHLLNMETPIVVVDSNPPRAGPEAQRAGSRAPQQPQPVPGFPVRTYGDSLFTDVFDCQRIDFRFLETQQNNQLEDPLPDSLFEPSHKKAERLERSIRNTEKGRAQHEKDQIIRLLEGLQGHDWLRVMGVSGITETKKKSFEPARRHFIKGCQNILEKFRAWNVEEKRRKQKKEKASQAQQQAALALQQQQQQQQQQERQKSEIMDSAEEEGSDNDTAEFGEGEVSRHGGEVVLGSEEAIVSPSDTSSEVSPAKQLRQEALARTHAAGNAKKSTKTAARAATPKLAEPPRKFTSFFSKKYQRDSALNRTRRTGRKVLAWGHPIPDIEHADFVLPEEYRDEELLKARARRKRRDKRHSRS